MIGAHGSIISWRRVYVNNYCLLNYSLVKVINEMGGNPHYGIHLTSIKALQQINEPNLKKHQRMCGIK